ncbi:MAG: DoxX family membrane protein [Verrucomicrobiales bacterium]|nr:DoxX family membrane protein [Verrucomicrobiales bacterium]
MKNAVWTIVALVIGALFIWSGIAKLKDPISFADSVRNFRIVGDPVAPAVALFLPFVEIFAGVALMSIRFAKGGAFVITGLMVVFTLLIGISWFRGLDITCGCFGDNDIVNYPVKMTQNVFLLVVGFALWLKFEMKGERPISESDSAAA